MAAYYNEHEPYAAAWLRNLIAAGHIAPGDVDERDIRDVRPDDLRGYRQCHFFAGLGGWSRALRLAGWDDDREVWTGSCPCQPFSAAGRGGGFADERHLWPSWHWLIAQRRPAVVFGEQVAAKAVEPWVDLVHADMEALGYRFGAVPVPAAGVGAPHIRDRLWWVADSDVLLGAQGGAQRGRRDSRSDAVEGTGSGGAVADGGLADDCGAGLEGRDPGSLGHERAAAERSGDAGGPGPLHGFWSAADWLLCRDGKWRPVEPGAHPLAHGVPARVGKLRAYGNAIVPQVAAEFVAAWLEEEAADLWRAGSGLL